ncbi:Hypothetical protein R9X50_00746900 [Acrodontium crateriforme]|uniref:Ankyrin repeat protein n=1 Tax=Acrodontium crateriforme TaxID=150365 RepID=A0AAQ3MDY2_9PEZI|nr:Hypothetical protein R9X50_00746900 [Acrodontium crateriforme]
MDPLSIAVGVSSLLGACAAVTRALQEAKGKYARSENTILAVLVECNIISSTLAQVRQILQSKSTPFTELWASDDVQLHQTFHSAMESCDVTLVALSDLLQKCNQQNSGGGLSWKGKTKLFFSDQEMHERLETLRSLNVAMAALLSAIQANSVAAMSQTLSRNLSAMETMNKETFKLKKRYTPSIISEVETTFDFDDELVNSDAYRRAFRSFTSVEEQVADLKLETNASVTPTQSIITPSEEATLVNSPNDIIVKQIHKDNQAPQKSTVDKADIESINSEQTAKTSRTERLQRESTALYHAANKGHIEIVRLLLNRGTKLALSKHKGDNALIGAALNGHLEVFKLLLSQEDGDINTTGDDKGTPLYWAAQRGHTGLLKFLLGLGAEASLPRFSDWTPLCAAAAQNHVAAVELLLGHGVQLNSQTPEGCTALYYAASKGHVEILQLLIQHGADVVLPAERNWTPLCAAASNGHPKAVELLLQRPDAPIDVETESGGTPLYWAATNGHVDVVRRLLEYGAEAILPRKNGFSPMSSAAFEGHLEIVEMLLEHESANEGVNTPTSEEGI